jgi:hypothetical protein
MQLAGKCHALTLGTSSTQRLIPFKLVLNNYYSFCESNVYQVGLFLISTRDFCNSMWNKLTVEFEVLAAVVMKTSTLWNMKLHADSCSAYSCTLKMKVTRCSKMSVDFQRAAGRYNPEDRTF